MSRWIRYTAAVAALSAVLVGLPGPPALADPGQAKLDEVLAALDVARLPADYVVLVDTSSSMQDGPIDLYTRARDALAPLLDSLDPVDRLTVISFDSVAVTSTFAEAGVGSAALRRLPARATGRDTDLGAAINAACTALDVPGRSDPAAVFLFTDGRLSPPAASPYTGTSAPAWKAMSERGRAIESRRPVRAYSVPLADSTDAAVLQSVFAGQFELINLKPDQIRPYLAQIKDQLKVRKAAAFVGRDTGGVTATIPAGATVAETGGYIDVTLTSTAERVPLTVTALRADAGGLPVDLSVAGGEVALKPKESKVVRVSVKPRAVRRFHFGRAVDLTPGTLTVSGAVSSPWSDVLMQDFRLPFAPTPVAGSAPVRVATAYGLSWWYPALFGLACALIGALIARRRRNRWHPLRGTLIIDEDDGVRSFEVPLHGRRVDFPRQPGAGDERPKGDGAVRGRRVSDLSGEDTEFELHVRYTRDGNTGHSVVRANEPGYIHDAEFNYRED